MFLIHKGLRDLERLNLGHSLTVSLCLPLVSGGLAALTHGRYLSLQDLAIVARNLLCASCYDFLTQAAIFHSYL